VSDQGLSCYRWTAAGQGDLYYAQLRSVSDGQLRIAALRHGDLLWTTDLPEYGCSPTEDTSGVQFLQVGADGNAYAIVNAPASDCLHRDYRLLGFRSSDGAITVDQNLTPIENGAVSFTAYTGGLLFATETDLYQLDYSGQITSDAPFPHPAQLDPSLTAMGATGRYFTILVRSTTSPNCPTPYNNIDSIVAYDNGDQLWQIPALTRYPTAGLSPQSSKMVKAA
jgi:hypothetical protein